MADPICRWRNSSIKQVMEFNSILPLSKVSKEEARTIIDKRWELMGYKDFFTTAYQLATQMGMYYEDDIYFYPRFAEKLDVEEAANYLHYWGSHYYAPNPYTRSMSKEQRPVIINRFLVNWILDHEKPLFSEALKAMFVDSLGNTDILINMVNNFLDVEVNEDVMCLKDGVQPIKYDQCYVNLDINDKKGFFEFVGLNQTANNTVDAFISSAPLQQIFYGAPGTGKSYTINVITNNEKSNTIRTTFHPDTDYSSFVGAYKPTTIEEPVMTVIDTKAVPVKNADGTPHIESKIIYEFVSQSFLKAYVNAWKLYTAANSAVEVEKQYLVIEEINRGNCAQIFGDLFQLLDRNDKGFSDYPITADADMQKQLRKTFSGLDIPMRDSINALYDESGRDIVGEVLDGKILLLPNNFYIWATMNTSDQSLFPIDSAFKRRWDWEYMPISNARKNWTIDANGSHYDWWQFLVAINKLIGSTTFSEDKKLGYFFCKAADKVISASKFVGKVIFYLWNDVFKDYGFDAAAFTDTEEGGKLSFDKFYIAQGHRNNVINERKVEIFLKNLGLEPINKAEEQHIEEIYEEDDDNSDDIQQEGNKKDNTKYQINGIGRIAKKNLSTELVRKYVELNPNLTAEEVVHNWTALGEFVSHFVETQETFDKRTDQSPRVGKVKCGNATIYVSTNGWGGTDIIKKLKQAVEHQNWGLNITELNN